MKKLLKRVLIIVGIIGILYLAYMFLVMPNGFISQQAVVASFVNNIEETNVCDEHFNTETTTLCETLQTEFEGKAVEFKSGQVNSSGMNITLLVDETEIEFEVTFTPYEPSGLRKFLNDEYYLIDTIN